MNERVQLGTTVSQRTRDQANDLIVAHGYSLRDLLTIAIDRMHREEIDMTDTFDRYVDRGTDPAELATWSQDDIENDIEEMAREDALGHNPDADEAEITAYREQIAAEILAEARRRAE